MNFPPKSPNLAKSRRGLELSITETSPIDAPKHLFRPLLPRNPHFPALRSGPTAVSGASRQKQIPSSLFIVFFLITFITNAQDIDYTAQSENQHIPDQGNGTPVLKDSDLSNIRILCYNMGTAPWSKKGEAAAGVIRDYSPDIIGLQEIRRDEEENVVKEFSRYEAFTQKLALKGLNSGEALGILYDKNKYSFDKDESHAFWLSDTPEVAGSKTWGNPYFRICLVARLTIKETGQSFYVYNTHWSWEPVNANFKSAQLVLKRINERKYKDEPVFMMGDFNLRGHSFDYITGKEVKGKKAKQGLLDTYKAVHSKPKGGIDFIFMSPKGIKAIEAEIIDRKNNSVPPSDHPLIFTAVVLESI